MVRSRNWCGRLRQQQLHQADLAKQQMQNKEGDNRLLKDLTGRHVILNAKDAHFKHCTEVLIKAEIVAVVPEPSKSP